jgi:hypothetical protein
VTWTTAILTLIPWLFLCMQGRARLKSPRATPFNHSFRLLNLLLAVTSLLLWVLLVSGTLVISPEFSNAMVQGPAAWYGMALLLITIALDTAVCLAISRLQSKRESYLGWLIAGGLIVGALAVLGLKPINPHDLEPLRIYSFDFWWPPLLLWISLCGLETILT